MDIRFRSRELRNGLKSGREWPSTTPRYLQLATVGLRRFNGKGERFARSLRLS